MVKKKDSNGWWCERITHIVVNDEEGNPTKAFGIGRDITEFKNSMEQMEER